MCCFLNRCCNPQNHCCFLQNNQAPYFWQAGLFANEYQANATSLANQTNAFNQTNANGLVQLNDFGNIAQCFRPQYTFANCCRGHRVFANNFALDRPVSASFLNTPDYHHIAEIGF